MKPSLQVRLSQHLALTPQLQQSIRLLQLSTLELASEVEQMLDDNPFLERATEEQAPREEFGLDRADTPAAEEPGDADASLYSSTAAATSATDSGEAPANDTELAASQTEQVDWEGDGTHDLRPDDSEWGGDAPSRSAAASAVSAQNSRGRPFAEQQAFIMVGT